jgi:hypothetical protein
LFIENVQKYNQIQKEYKIYSEKLLKEFQQKENSFRQEEMKENLQRIEDCYLKIINSLQAPQEYTFQQGFVSFSKIRKLNQEIQNFYNNLKTETHLVEKQTKMKEIFESQSEITEILKKLTTEMKEILEKENNQEMKKILESETFENDKELASFLEVEELKFE